MPEADLYLGTRLKAYILTVFIGQLVVNAYLSIKMIRPDYCDLRCFRRTRKWRFGDFFAFLGQLAHCGHAIGPEYAFLISVRRTSQSPLLKCGAWPSTLRT